MKILLADDHSLFLEGMRYILRDLSEQIAILEASNFPAAIQAAKDNPDLDLVLLDLNMPGSDGVTSVGTFHKQLPGIPIVVVSGTERRGDIEKVMNYGAKGFISKMSSGLDMVHALRLVLDGGVYLPPQLLNQASDQPQKDKRSWGTNEYGLTVQQMNVLQQLALGLSNKDIGLAIGLAEGTVKVHIAAIYQALKVNKRIEAIQAAKNLGLLVEV